MLNHRLLLAVAIAILLPVGHASRANLPHDAPALAHDLEPLTIYIEPNGWQAQLGAPVAVAQTDDRLTAQLTLDFCPDYDAAYRAYAQDWFAAVYPAIVAILGEPYKSDNVCLCPTSYAGWPPGCDSTVSGAYPVIKLPYDPSNRTDSWWDHAMTHEFIHAHHGLATPSYCAGSQCYGDWLEEGLTEASTELVEKYAWANDIRYMSGSNVYVPELVTRVFDTRMLAGIEFWGGSPVPYYKCRVFEAYQASTALFWLVGTSQSGAGGNVNAGDWINYDWFRRLTQSVYAWKHSNPSTRMTHEQFYQLVDQLSPLPVDGQKASDWMKAQPITHYGNPPGHYLGAFPEPEPVNPQRVFFSRYTLDDSNPQREVWYTGPFTASYQVYNDQGLVITGTTDYHFDRPCAARPAGAYRVEVQADLGGTLRTASTVFICTSQTITNAASGVGLILMNADGTLFDGTATSTSGDFSFNTGAGAILRPNNVSLLPATIGLGFQPTIEITPSLPVTGTFMLYLPLAAKNWPPPDVRFYNLPLPFSRIIVAVKPDD